MLSDHMQIIEKRGCRIVTSHPEANRLEGVTQNGEIVPIVIGNTSAFFRWPRVGENWMIRHENGSWFLEGIFQNENDKRLKTQTEPGDIHINAPGHIFLSTGLTIARKYTQIIGKEAETIFTVKHELNDPAIQVSAISVPAHKPIVVTSWTPIDLNSLKITLASAPGNGGALVIVTG